MTTYSKKSKVSTQPLAADVASGDWPWRQGMVTELLGQLELRTERTLAMLCGPEIMMRYAIIELTKRGVPEADIHVSMERNMKCAIGHCGRCQLGPNYVCKDGPVFEADQLRW